MIFDSHSHYDDSAFDEDRNELLGSMSAGGIGHIISVAAEWNSFDKIFDICSHFSFCHPALGIHPEKALDLSAERRPIFEKLLQEKTPVAIGEIGLDYYYEDPPREIQKEAFIYQLELAKRFNLPVIVHSRDAAEDTLDIIRAHCPERKGVIHCFSSSYEIAREYVNMGFLIGIGGVVTFKNGKKLKEVAANIPLSSILIETDCPYMAPTPHRGERNTSLFLPFVVSEIASLRGISDDEVINVTEQNAKRLFGII